MLVRVRIPELLWEATGGEANVEVSAATIAELISAVDVVHPGFAGLLLDESGLRRYWCIHVNGRDVRWLDGLATAVSPADHIWILPTSSGGMFLPTVATKTT